MGAERPLPPLALGDVAFAYGERQVLDRVELEVVAGEVVGLLGPNGSGKSTLVRIASGVLGGYRGSVRLAGDEIRSLAPREVARRVAVVPQESTFAFGYTALEVVLLGRHPHLAGTVFESRADVELAREALRRAGALELESRAIHELSSGERQRVVFAKALAQAAPLLLLDEPTSFLDIRHQVELCDLVHELAHEKGRAVLAVLHDLNLAAEYCDRIVLIREGRIAASGPAAEVLTCAYLKQVYETEVTVDVNDLTGRVLVAPLSRRRSRGGP
jgi:iron complex transport system ATP-binding protein